MTDQASGGVRLEVCVGSLADAVAAASAGADRLELCSALELGGLTPSLGLIEQVVGDVNLPTMAMIRPRTGGFCYSEGEFSSMLRDGELALLAGAQGIVFGCLNANSAIDVPRTSRLVHLAGQRETVFHRAFDFVRDSSKALEELIGLGITRVLTTGGAASAIEGAESVRRLNVQSAGRIEIMPGGGVTAASVAELIAVTGCNQVHAGAATSSGDASMAPADAAGLCDLQRLAAGELRVVDAGVVAALVRALRG